MDEQDRPRCGFCNKTDGLLYTTAPPMVRCTVTGEYHREDDRCNVPAAGDAPDGKPCDNCERGWGAATGDGTRVSCEDNCKRLNEYRQKHPRICEVLGVDVGENITYADPNGEEIGLKVLEDGSVELTFKGGMQVGWAGTGYVITQAINHPDRIIRKPRFTEEEVADAKAIARIYRSAVVGRLENGKPYTSNRVMSLMEAWSDNDRITYLPERLFPSLRPGASISLEDLFNEAT